jgi:hypothetical protein
MPLPKTFILRSNRTPPSIVSTKSKCPTVRASPRMRLRWRETSRTASTPTNWKCTWILQALSLPTVHIFLPASSNLIDCQLGNFARILMLHPSTDFKGPLNWPSWRKHTPLVISCVIACLSTYSSAGFSSLSFGEFLQCLWIKSSSWPITVSSFGIVQFYLGTFGFGFRKGPRSH